MKVLLINHFRAFMMPAIKEFLGGKVLAVKILKKPAKSKHFDLTRGGKIWKG